MRFGRCFIGSLVALTILPATISAQSVPGDEALPRLETHLEKVRSEVQFNRMLGGGMLVGTGVLTGAAGATMAWLAYPNGTAVDTDLRNGQIVSSILTGALYAGTGALLLFLKDGKETMPERFFAYPSTTEQEKLLKVVAGEVTLQGLADRGQTDRLWTAGFLGILGGTVVGLSTPWATVGAASSSSSWATNPGLYAGGGLLVGAVLNLVLESTPERENRVYLAWKAQAGRP